MVFSYIVLSDKFYNNTLAFCEVSLDTIHVFPQIPTFEHVLLYCREVRRILDRQSLEELGVQDSFHRLHVRWVEGGSDENNIYLQRWGESENVYIKLVVMYPFERVIKLDALIALL